jgi:hypothetical protein
LFRSIEITQTEKLIYWLWDGVKRRNSEQFLSAVRSLSNWLSEEQFNAVIEECKRNLTLKDKAWLLTALAGHRLSPMSLLFPCHWERKGVVGGNSLLCELVILFCVAWVEFNGGTQWESN